MIIWNVYIIVSYINIYAPLNILILLLLNQKIRQNRMKKFHNSKIMKNSNHISF